MNDPPPPYNEVDLVPTQSSTKKVPLPLFQEPKVNYIVWSAEFLTHHLHHTQIMKRRDKYNPNPHVPWKYKNKTYCTSCGNMGFEKQSGTICKKCLYTFDYYSISADIDRFQYITKVLTQTPLQGTMLYLPPGIAVIVKSFDYKSHPRFCFDKICFHCNGSGLTTVGYNKTTVCGFCDGQGVEITLRCYQNTCQKRMLVSIFESEDYNLDTTNSTCVVFNGSKTVEDKTYRNSSPNIFKFATVVELPPGIILNVPNMKHHYLFKQKRYVNCNKCDKCRGCGLLYSGLDDAIDYNTIKKPTRCDKCLGWGSLKKNGKTVTPRFEELLG